MSIHQKLFLVSIVVSALLVGAYFALSDGPPSTPATSSDNTGAAHASAGAPQAARPKTHRPERASRKQIAASSQKGNEAKNGIDFRRVPEDYPFDPLAPLPSIRGSLYSTKDARERVRRIADVVLGDLVDPKDAKESLEKLDLEKLGAVVAPFVEQDEAAREIYDDAETEWLLEFKPTDDKLCFDTRDEAEAYVAAIYGERSAEIRHLRIIGALQNGETRHYPLVADPTSQASIYHGFKDWLDFRDQLLKAAKREILVQLKSEPR